MTTVCHFSDDPSIEQFVPRPVLVPSERGPGLDWLNGPLVWAIAPEREYLYLFPRDCPRIVAWATPRTSDADRERWLGEAPAVVHVEWAWLERLRTGRIWRYTLSSDTFEAVDGDWCFVSHATVTPEAVDDRAPLLDSLAATGAELRVLPSLGPLRGLWSQTTLHVSGQRLRNCHDGAYD